MKNFFLQNWPFIVSGWEVLSHAIPTNRNYSLLNKIGMAITFISNLLNRKSKYRVNENDRVNIIFILFFCSLVFVSCKTLEKIDCRSTKYVSVTIVDTKGKTYTVEVPYCDTIGIKDVSDTINLKRK